MGRVLSPSIQAYPKRKLSKGRCAWAGFFFPLHSNVPEEKGHGTTPDGETCTDIYWALQLGFNRGVLTAAQLILTAVQ